MKNCEFKNKHKCKLNEHNCDMNNCPLLRDPTTCGHSKNFSGTMICELECIPCGVVWECPNNKIDKMKDIWKGSDE